MLSVSELQTFSEAHVAARPNLENYFMVASDDELAGLYRDITNEGEACTLVVVMPTFDGNIPDEDNRRLRNNLYFMVVKKTDKKAGHDARVEIFKKTQEEIKQLLIKVLDLHFNFGTNCLFRDIDLSSIRIDPVQDYVGSNGFQIEFSTLTKIQ